MQTISKAIILVVILFCSLVLVINQEIEPSGVRGCWDEYLMTFKIGDYLEALHFHNVIAGKRVKIDLEDPDGYTFFYKIVTAEYSGDLTVPVGKYLTKEGSYRMDDWYIEGVIDGYGHGFRVEKYASRGEVQYVDASPTTVSDGDTVTVSFSIKNTGDVPFTIDYCVAGIAFGSSNYPQKALYNLPYEAYVGKGNTWSDSFTFEVVSEYVTTSTNTIKISVEFSATGDTSSYPEGYVSDLAMGRGTKTINYKEPEYTLIVNTNPKECKVTVKDTTKPSTNGYAVFENLVRGNYEVSVAKEDYYSKTENVVLDRPKEIDIKLEPLPPPLHNLTVKTTPPLSRVKIYNVGEKISDDKGYAVFNNIEEGSYTIAISKTGYLTKTDSFLLDNDKSLWWELDSLHTLTITTEPPGTLVTVVGKSSIISDAEGKATFSLPSGTYTVSASKGTFNPMSIRVALDEDKEIKFSLQSQQVYGDTQPISGSPEPIDEIPTGELGLVGTLIVVGLIIFIINVGVITIILRRKHG